MRRFLIISILAALFHLDAAACAWEGPTHNAYMFSIFRRESVARPFLDEVDAYWRSYAQEQDSSLTDYFINNKDKILAVARRKGDKQMMRYVALLADYLDACKKVSVDNWQYPTKEDIIKGKSILRRIRSQAAAQTGARYRGMFSLLVMRANMMLGDDARNLTYWKTSASKTTTGVWREMARNIYARALLKAGRRREACDIYASQGDMQSIKWCVRNYRNLAGIQRIYAEDPSSPTLRYLVQDFVNNAQETLDTPAEYIYDKIWFKEIGAMPIYKNEVDAFITFADKVVAEGKTCEPCLWRAASGMLRWLFGRQAEAVADLNSAMTLDGTPRMKDNARCIRLLVSVGSATLGGDYSAWLVQEFRWLNVKIKEERGNSEEYNNHYTDVKDRVVYKALIPKYENAGLHNQTTALYGMIREDEVDFISRGNHAKEGLYRDGDYAWNTDYAGFNEYFGRLDSLDAKGVAGYYTYLTSSKTDVFDDYVARRVYANPQYYYDLIGTKYISEGRFAEAVPYLEKVEMDFIAKQNICCYMAKRDYTVERWFHRQKFAEDEPCEQPLLATPSENLKLKFCKDMLELKSQYSLAREGVNKDELAYRLAILYFQASCFGDCWFLTAYGNSLYGLLYEDPSFADRYKRKFDFVATALSLLKECKRSSSQSLRYKALYALAFIPTDPWYSVDWDGNYDRVDKIHIGSRQYNALGELHRFARSYPQYVDSYTTRCDILKRFVAMTGGNK